MFALIALAVAGDARSHREARIHPLVTALTIALVVRWLGFFVANQAQTVPLFAIGVYGVPIGFSAIAVMVPLHAPHNGTADRLGRGDFGVVRRMGERVTLLRHRLMGHKAQSARGPA